MGVVLKVRVLWLYLCGISDGLGFAKEAKGLHLLRERRVTAVF